MFNFSIVKEHKWKKEETERKIISLTDGILNGRLSRHNISYNKISSGTIQFSGSGFNGFILYNCQNIEIRVDLSFMLLPFREMIKREINEYLDINI